MMKGTKAQKTRADGHLALFISYKATIDTMTTQTSCCIIKHVLSECIKSFRLCFSRDYCSSIWLIVDVTVIY